MMSPTQMTTTTSDHVGCHAARKKRSMQYSTPSAIRPTVPMHMAIAESRDRRPPRSRKLKRNTSTHAQPRMGRARPRNHAPPLRSMEMRKTYTPTAATSAVRRKKMGMRRASIGSTNQIQSITAAPMT